MIFGGTTRLTPVNDIAGLTIGTGTTAPIDFLATAGAFTLRGNAITLGGTGGILSRGTNLQTISLNMADTVVRTFSIAGGGEIRVGGVFSGAGAGILTARLSGTGTATLTLAGANTYAGGTTVANLTQLNINNAGSGGTSSAIGTGTLVFSTGSTSDNTSGGAITLSTNNAVTLVGMTFGGSNDLHLGTGAVNLGTAVRIVTINGGSTLTLGGVASGSGGGITVDGLGAGSLALTGANTYTGRTSVNDSQLDLDFSATGAPTDNIINNAANTAPLTLGGGTLNIIGKSSATNTQRFNATTFATASASKFVVTQNGATSVSATFGALTRSAGSTVDFTLPTTGTITSTTVTSTGTNKINGNGIAYSTVGGTTWLVNNAGTLSALGAGSYNVDTYTASLDTDIQTSATPAAFTVNTLRFNTASKTLTLNSSGASTVTAGGILVTSAGTGSVIASGGAGAGLQPGATGKELVIHNYADLDIQAPIVNNGANVTILTLAGTGTTKFSVVNTFTGALNVTGGNTLNLNGISQSVGGLGGDSGSTVTNEGASDVTLTTATGTTTFGGVIQDGATNKIALTVTSGTQTLGSGASDTAANTYTGLTTVNGGTLALNKAAAPGANAIGGNLVLNAGTLSFSQAAANDQIVDTADVTFNGGTSTITDKSETVNNFTNSGGSITISGGTGGGVFTATTSTLLNSGTFTLQARNGSWSTGTMTINGGTNLLDASNGNAGVSLTVTNGLVINQPVSGAFTALTLQNSAGQSARVDLVSDLTFNGAAGNANSTTIAAAFSGSGTAALNQLRLTNVAGAQTRTFNIIGGGSAAVDLIIQPNIVNGTATGSGITKTGAGTMELQGINTYTGATTVNAGTVLVSGSIVGSTAVNSGGTLGGTGTVGAVTVNSGASLQGGDGTAASGALSSGGAVALTDGLTIKLTLGAGGTHSTLARTGGIWSFDPDQAFLFNSGAAAGTYDNIITGLAGTETGLGSIGTWTLNPEYFGSTFSYDGAGGVDLVLVPEPGALVSLMGGLGMLLGLQRFRRRRS